MPKIVGFDVPFSVLFARTNQWQWNLWGDNLKHPMVSVHSSVCCVYVLRCVCSLSCMTGRQLLVGRPGISCIADCTFNCAAPVRHQQRGNLHLLPGTQLVCCMDGNGMFSNFAYLSFSQPIPRFSTVPFLKPATSDTTGVAPGCSHASGAAAARSGGGQQHAPDGLHTARPRRHLLPWPCAPGGQPQGLCTPPSYIVFVFLQAAMGMRQLSSGCDSIELFETP